MQPERLGPYRIVGILGRGGMGAVYRAINAETEEPAAVKILDASLAESEDFRQRFETEIETLRKLRHPNIVRLFGFGEQDGLLFYAMELVNGRSLEQELHGGRLFGWREVTQIGIEMCRALRHAHDRGIIHRDIKPANLLLTADGQLKLSDFGIARLFGYSRLTAVGSVLGTVEFMSPEQADDGPVGPPSDLYSLGVVMYTLLARRPPFRAKSLPGLLAMLRTARPEPVRRYASDVPAPLESVITQLLAKDPRKRFATANVLFLRLEAIVDAEPVQAPPPKANPFKGAKTGPEPAPGDATAGQPKMDDLTQTHVVEQVVERPSGQGELLETKETSALKDLVDVEAADAEEKDARASGEHFVVVPEEDLDRFETDEPTRGALISIQTWVLAVTLIILGLTAWYFLQEPSADALHERIMAATADKEVSSYRRAEDDIRKFLTYYSDDPRGGQMQEYMRKIELARLESQYDRVAKGLMDTGRLLPVERDYLEAIKYMRLDPDWGELKLEALVALYSHGKDTSGPTGQCVELARRRLKQLAISRDIAAAEHLALVLARLDDAEKIAATDPERASQIRRAVIELYQGKRWAREAVSRAEETLEAEPATSHGPAEE